MSDLFTAPGEFDGLVPETWPLAAREHLLAVIRYLVLARVVSRPEIDRLAAAFVSGWELRKCVAERSAED